MLALRKRRKASDHAQREPAPEGARQRRTWRGRILRLSFVGVLIILFGYYLLPFFIPLPPGLSNAQAQGTGYLDVHGKPLRRSLSEDGQRRQRWLSYEELPKALICQLGSVMGRILPPPTCSPLAFCNQT